MKLISCAPSTFLPNGPPLVVIASVPRSLALFPRKPIEVATVACAWHFVTSTEAQCPDAFDQPVGDLAHISAHHARVAVVSTMPSSTAMALCVGAGIRDGGGFGDPLA